MVKSFHLSALFLHVPTLVSEWVASVENLACLHKMHMHISESILHHESASDFWKILAEVTYHIWNFFKWGDIAQGFITNKFTLYF